jgi:Kef-type K+ transport system membrane component KefB
MLDDLRSLLAVMVVVAVAPIVVGLLPGRVPQVVAMLLGGILLGPEVLDLAHPTDLELFANLGLGFLFLLAGYELDPKLLRDRSGMLAIVGWVVSAVLAVVVVGVLAWQGFVHAYVPVAIALTTTALGTLLPILHENGLTEGRFGRTILAAGASGELGPVLAIALLLGNYGSFLELLGVAAVAAAAFVLSLAPRLISGNRIGRIVAGGEQETSQTTLRLTVLLLLLLLYLSARFGLDIVLGAFFAGMVLRCWPTGDVHALQQKLDAIGYGLFIPVFFVVSGMGLDVSAIINAPTRLLVFFVLLLAVRGVPALVVYRRDFVLTRRLQLMLITATTLPLLVALTEVGLENGSMLPENAAALVGAGVLSVAIFPLIAIRLQDRAARAEELSVRDDDAGR